MSLLTSSTTRCLAVSSTKVFSGQITHMRTSTSSNANVVQYPTDLDLPPREDRSVRCYAPYVGGEVPSPPTLSLTHGDPFTESVLYPQSRHHPEGELVFQHGNLTEEVRHTFLGEAMRETERNV